MTKKHFTAIARILSGNRPSEEFGKAHPDLAVYREACVNDIRDELATYFKSENERFDKERFKEACE